MKKMNSKLRTSLALASVALLAIAVVEALLHAPHLSVGDAVGGPSRKTHAIAWVLGEIGQVLQANAFAIFCMAGGASKVVRATPLEEQTFAHFVESFFCLMGLR